MTLKRSVYIDAPVEKVFDFFRNPMNWHAVSRGVVFKDVHVTPDGVGTYYAWVSSIAGMRLKGFDVFTEFVPNERITDWSSSDLEGTWTYTFTEEDGGTRLTMENHTRSFWKIPPLGTVVEAVGAKNHERVLVELKATMESRAA